MKTFESNNATKTSDRKVPAVNGAAASLDFLRSFGVPDQFRSFESMNGNGGRFLDSQLSTFFSSKDWLPRDPAIDNNRVMKFFASQASGSGDVWEQLARQASMGVFAMPTASTAYQGHTDWNNFYQSKLPPSIPGMTEPPIISHSEEDTAAAAEALASISRESTFARRKLEEQDVDDSEYTEERTQEKKPPKRKRQRRNHEPDKKDYVEVHDGDVLFGRGGRTNHHPGNKRYLEAKDSIQERYMKADKNEKTAISQELVDMVHAWGGRFLKLEKGTEDKWYQVLNITARKKASQTLREVNTPEERAQKRARYTK